jgi:hypothetical protein
MWHQHPPRRSIGGSGHRLWSITSAARPSPASCGRHPLPHAQGCPGKICGGIREEIGPLISSWPGVARLGRPSTSSSARNKVGDTRIKSAQDDLRPMDASPRPVIRARKISPENPTHAGEACNVFGRVPV